jgi:glycosyltransferase involved in cell wall biosynthesis
MVPAWAGQQTCAELHREALAGLRPRSDYVELARALDADVMDMQYLAERAAAPSRALTRRGRLVPAQIIDAFLKQRRYEHIVARADRLGLPLALLFKLTRGRRDLVLISAWLSRRKKAVFLSPLKVHSHLRAITNYSSVQMEFAASRLAVPRAKLHLCLQPVDERFWHPAAEPEAPVRDRVISVGSEARDYRTLARALDGLDVTAELAIGSSVLGASGDVEAEFGPMARDAVKAGSPGRIRTHQQLAPSALRRLYAQARLAVVPLHDVDVDAGVTAITEAMAMAKAVVVTRTRGQVDVVREGETGLYVPPGDPGALRAAIAHLLRNPDVAERMGRAGRELVESRHTLDGWVSTVAGIVRTPPP